MATTPAARPAERDVGARVVPIETRRLLAGAGRYTADIQPQGLQHVAFVRSPHAHARILSVDPSAAKALAGVSDVLTSAEALERATPLRAAANLLRN